MEFLVPLMLVGAIGAAIPLAIHLIGRRRARTVRFAAMDFLLGSNKKTARKLRLRELLLLAARVLVCLAIPAALAKPFTSCATEGPLVERGPQAAVLVVDDSFISRYRLADGGPAVMDRVIERAQSILEQLGPEAEVAVVRTSEGSDAPAELSRDHVRLRDQISDLSSSFRPADITTALRRAGQLLAASDHERRIVYLLSPLPATGFRTREPPWPTGPEAAAPELIPIDVTGGVAAHAPGPPPDGQSAGGSAPPGAARLANAAVTGLEVERDPGSGSRGVRVIAEIANYGPAPLEDLGVALRIDDRVVARGAVSLAPGERKTKPFLAVLPVRTADVSIEIATDALPEDDRRRARAELRDEIRVLLVNGDPHTVRHEDELFYLEAALRPGDRADTGSAVTTATADVLKKLDLTEFDVAVLANVTALPAADVARLAAWVESGGGLLVAVGDNVSADAYNRTMKPLLPQELHDPIDTAFGTSGRERRERALALTKWEADHPIFTVFSKDAPGLRAARFTRAMLLGPTTRVDDRQVIARYTNGAAALVIARSGAGRLALFTSTLDRDWNDLPIHPGFLPLTQQTVRFLARANESRRRGPILVGRTAIIPVGPDDARIEVREPSGNRTVIEGDELAGRGQIRFAQPPEPGIYRVVVTDRSGREHSRPEADFAVVLDPRGSDVRPVADILGAGALPGASTRTASIRPATHERRVELWHAVAVGLLILLVIESLLVLR